MTLETLLQMLVFAGLVARIEHRFTLLEALHKSCRYCKGEVDQ